MENKRKASGANGLESGPDTPDRAAKRRKLQEEFGDLANGETPQSTTAYGLNMLETIRATTDKNGRPVAPFFETLPSKAEDREYYKKIRLPLSLELLERKLNNHEYPNLSSLEGDFKRLVSNAKETNPRQSEIFGDAERIRKAVSNLMVKHNPAYKFGNYQAVATPLPPSPGGDGTDLEDDAPGVEEDGDMDADADAGRDRAEDEDDEDDEEEDAESDDEPEPEPVTRKRRGGRLSRGPPVATPKASRSSSAQATQETDVVGYQGLTFQQAQEKIVADLVQKKDENGDIHFIDFLYLPPRSLKEYFDVIAEPTSLKALQKQVRGQRGRSAATGVSEFKSWSLFEDQASLIWKNAYHFNEDGSPIYQLAQELEACFYEYFEEAQREVPEPPQPKTKDAPQTQKIKLRVSQNAVTPAPSKKIILNVAGRSNAAASPAPGRGSSAEGETTRNGTPVGRNPLGVTAAVNLNHLEKARSLSTPGASPSPSVPAPVKPEETARQSPATAPPGPALTTLQQFAPVAHGTPLGVNGAQSAHPPPPPPPPPAPKLSAADILEGQKYRPHTIEESEVLMPQLTISSHPSLALEKPLEFTFRASPTETQQEFVLNAPASYFRLQLRPQIAPFLEAQQREWKLHVMHDFSRLYPSSLPTDKRNEPVFDANLRYGTNRFEVGLVAALPKGEKGPHGLNMEMEKFVVLFNLLKHY